MSKKERRLGKGLKKDYRQNLISKDTQEFKPSDSQQSSSPEVKKSRKQTTVYLTKQQLRAMKKIQMELSLNNDFNIENSEIAGLGIEILREIFNNPKVQKSTNLETLKAKCLEILRKHQES